MFLRDTGFYLTAVSIIIIYGIIGVVYWWMIVIYMCLYIVFILYTIILEKKNKN